MILQVYLYGNPVLKEKSENVTPEHPGLKQLIDDMFETMYAADGVGLAAPQVGHAINLFIVDASPFADEYPEAKEFKKVFINAHIIDESGDEWYFNEGCLSFPALREDILRKPNVTIQYFDENFVKHEDVFSGINARIIQHEYDHIKGKVFVDKLSFLKKRLIKNKLNDIVKGNVKASYKVKTHKK